MFPSRLECRDRCQWCVQDGHTNSDFCRANSAHNRPTGTSTEQDGRNGWDIFAFALPRRGIFSLMSDNFFPAFRKAHKEKKEEEQRSALRIQWKTKEKILLWRILHASFCRQMSPTRRGRWKLKHHVPLHNPWEKNQWQKLTNTDFYCLRTIASQFWFR